MTGPQHYREAEQLLAQAAEAEVGSDIERYALAAAQVHATLALAAASALTEGGFTQPDWETWIDAASAYKRDGGAS